jgi:Spy/CpxP family protein refolding chaperone
MNTTYLRKGLALACLGLLLAAPALRADDSPDGKGGPEAQGKMLDHMKKDLDLSDSQADQIKAENAADWVQVKTLRDKMKLDVDSLKVLVDRKAADDELVPAIGAVKADRQAMDEQKAKHMDAMQAILNPTQQAKGILMMMEHMKHDKGPDGGPKDGGK